MPIVLYFAYILSAIFILLALLHFAWALGSDWGLEKAIPKKDNGKEVMQPSNTSSAVVGLGLLFFAAFYLINAGIIPFQLPAWGMNITIWFIPIIFLVRAMGDFKYVGFFKHIKNTEFATADTKFHSPLCLFIGIVGIFIAVF